MIECHNKGYYHSQACRKREAGRAKAPNNFENNSATSYALIRCIVLYCFENNCRQSAAASYGPDQVNFQISINNIKENLITTNILTLSSRAENGTFSIIGEGGGGHGGPGNERYFPLMASRTNLKTKSKIYLKQDFQEE